MSTYHADLLERAVPRYTSYPTAAEFNDGITVGQVVGALEALEPAKPVSLYVHIPYCTEICWYCGCNTGAAGRSSRLEAYLDALDAEIDLIAARLPSGVSFDRLSFGGGSPNAISPVQFVRLMDRLYTRLKMTAPIISVELDPRGLDAAWGAALKGAGVHRASLGVQTFADHVQRAIGRIQPVAMIEHAVDLLRGADIETLGFDLMYGLPGQSRADLEDTITRALALAPDRASVFGYAHLPSLLPRQRRIDGATLPGGEARFEQAASAHRQFRDAGFQAVGFDHFARPTDPLAIAARSGQLRRNFQGYTDDPCDTLVGLGASAISKLPSLFAQNEKMAGRYRMLVSSGSLSARRGVERSAQSMLRGDLIERFLCDGRVVVPGEMLAYIEGAITPYQDRGLVSLNRDVLVLHADGWPYARAVASLFDAFRSVSQGTFSQAI